MSQHYSNPERANDPYALPNIETFYIDPGTPNESCPQCDYDYEDYDSTPHSEHVGWYWQSCFPGCLPDGEPSGPFDTEQEAIDDAQVTAANDAGEGEEDDLPPCAVAMGCLCAGHARGNPASAPCDTRETENE